MCMVYAQKTGEFCPLGALFIVSMPPRVISSLDELQSLAGSGVVASSSWIQVEQPMIDSFAAVSGDRQWIHVDTERAREEARGKPQLLTDS